MDYIVTFVHVFFFFFANMRAGKTADSRIKLMVSCSSVMDGEGYAQTATQTSVSPPTCNCHCNTFVLNSYKFCCLTVLWEHSIALPYAYLLASHWCLSLNYAQDGPFYLISMEYVLFKVGTSGCGRVALGETRHWFFFLCCGWNWSARAVRWSDGGEREEHTGLSVYCQVPPPPTPACDPAWLRRAHRVTLAEALVRTWRHVGVMHVHIYTKTKANK